MANPIHQEDGKWWFWDESWCDRHGPFETEAEAREELADYCVYLETGIDVRKGKGKCRST